MRPNQQHIFQGHSRSRSNVRENGSNKFCLGNLKNRSKWGKIKLKPWPTCQNDGLYLLIDFLWAWLSWGHVLLGNEWFLFFSGVGQIFRWCNTCGTDSLNFPFRDIWSRPWVGTLKVSVKFHSHLLRRYWCSQESKKRSWDYGHNMNFNS